MSDLVKAKEPFRFSTRLHLSELTGLRAQNLTQLLEGVKTVPGSSIYHHTHRFLQEHQNLSPEPPNDFAYWTTYALGEVELGERLASIDTMSYSTLLALREKITEVLERYIKDNAFARSKSSRKNEEFNFVKSVSLVLPTNFVVSDLREFAEALKKVTIHSIYFHVFEARLRLERPTNDFSSWIEESLGDRDLAVRIARLDPYTHTLENLRSTIIDIVEKKAMGVSWSR